MRILKTLKGYQYTIWIIVAVAAGMIFPEAFTKWGSFDLRNKWLMLVIIQLVMFGMGIQMKLKDFSGLAQTGKGVAIGLLCHFSIMPLMGLSLTKIFNFEPEIAAGIILIGSCSSGLASNVMVYLAKANLVLSVIVTAMATMAAPFLTPLLMKLLAGKLIEINVLNMMMEIIKIVIVPIGAALLHDYLSKASARGKRIVTVIFIIAVLWLAALALGSWKFFEDNITSKPFLQSIEIFGFLLGAVIAGVLYHQLAKRNPKIDTIMPYLSMFGIIYFTLVTTAAGRENLMKVGFILFISSVIHNAAGYFFGYWLSRLFKLDVNSSRTIAFEVGLQNGGMASGLAASMGKLGTVGLPAAVFSPWMNISGSILAKYWAKRTKEKKRVVSVIVICIGFSVTTWSQVSSDIMESIYNEVKTPYKYGLVVVPGENSKKIDCPSVFRKGKNWYMTYIQFDGRGYETWLSTSKDLLNWKTLGKIMSFSDTTDPIAIGWDNNQKAGYIALQDHEWGGSYELKKYNNKFWLSYFGGKDRGYEAGPLSLGIANTEGDPTNPHEWKRLDHPVLSSTDKDVRWWENKKLFKSTVVWDKAKTTGYPFVMYYNANGDSSGNKPKWRWFERIGMAVSNDMVNWKRLGADPVVHHPIGITGDAVIQKIRNVWVMFYFGAFWEPRKDAFNRFACSFDLVNWTDWTGPDLIKSSEQYDERFAHKSFVVKHKGVVYHFYCAVNNKDQRGIAVATSVDKGKSRVNF